MKFFNLAALAAVATTEAHVLVQDTPTAGTHWTIEGVKGFYDGYYKAFYKTVSSDMDKCLNEETVNNIDKLTALVMDPMAALGNIANIQEDINLFGDTAEVFQDLSICHFEESVFDIMGLCASNPDACAMPKLTENLTKNMFVLVGKITSLGESMQGFPAAEAGEFKEQMKELGQDAGTVLRIVFDFHKDI